MFDKDSAEFYSAMSHIKEEKPVKRVKEPQKPLTASFADCALDKWNAFQCEKNRSKKAVLR